MDMIYPSAVEPPTTVSLGYPTRCAWHPVTGALPYQRFAKVFLQRSPSIVKGRSLTLQDVNDWDFLNIRGQLGATLYSENPDIQLQPLLLEERHRSKSKRGDWERAKKEGRIYITPILQAQLLVVDQPVPVGGTMTYHKIRGHDSRQVLEKVTSSCSPTTAYAWTDEGDWSFTTPEGHEGFGSHSTYGTLTWHQGITEFKSGTRDMRTEIERTFAVLNNAAIMHELNSGLITAAAAELNQEAWDILTELGELPETLGMVYSGCKAILNIYSDLRRNNPLGLIAQATGARLKKRSPEAYARYTARRTAKEIDAAAQVWMTYRYGIMPLVYSIGDALDFLASKGFFRTIRKREDDTVTVNVGSSTHTVAIQDRCWGKMSIDLTKESWTNGLSANPITTAWELTPLSFVVDWAINVGDLLAALVPPSEAKEIKYQYSRKVDQELVFWHSSGVPLKGSYRFYQARQVDPLTYARLQLKPNMTLKRSLDALALSWMGARKSFLSPGSRGP